MWMRRLPVLALAGLMVVPLFAAGCLPRQETDLGVTGPITSTVTSSASSVGLAGLDASQRVIPAATPPAELSPSATASGVDPLVELRSAAAALQVTSFRFTLGDDSRRAVGVYDVTTHAVSLSRTADGRITTVYVSGNELLVAGLAPDATTLKFDPARMPSNHVLFPAAAPLLPLYLVTSARKLEPRDHGYAGKLDLTKVDLSKLGQESPPALARYVAYLAKQAGDRVHDVGFTVTVDSAGRLAGFRAIFPRADNGRDLDYEFLVIAAGTSASVSRPTGSIVEAPTAAYQP